MATPLPPDRTEALTRHRAAGGRIAGVLPVHSPRALLRAHGLLPIEVWGPPGVNTASADSQLQAYTCSVVRCGLAHLLDRGLEAVDVLVAPHACDSIQGLTSLLIDFVRPSVPVLPLYMPRGGGESSVDFLYEELRAMHGRLAEICGVDVTDDAIAEAVAHEEEADSALARLWAARRTIGLGSRAFYELVRTREYLPAEAFTELAEAHLVAAADEPGTVDGLPILLSGMLPEPMSVLDAIDEAGGVVVADDLACSGRRLYPPGQSSDPVRRIAEGILGAPPGPTMGGPIRDRAEHLVRLCTESGARAVLFYTVKFCEPELFYLPLLRKALDAAGIRSLRVEVDINAIDLPNQLITRLEALMETVS